MKTKNRLLASVLCLLMVAVCVVGLTACGGEDECSHQWGEWSTTTNATCTAAGTQERKCTECGEKETSTIHALGHDWNEATCSAPKTCKTCSATEGEALAHAYTVETVKDEALKSAATCGSAAVYFKSCSCGAISTNEADTFTSGSALEHKDENHDHACDNGCGKTDMGTHADTNKDHACDYGCATAIGACEDANKDHACDYGCAKTLGEHADGDDNNHLCDYGCGKIADSGCYDTVVDGKCDECGADFSHTCVDEDKNHACDSCSTAMGEHADANKDHVCDYGCATAIGTCEDADKNHACDYGCDKTLGTCEDANKDHACDYGCGKAFGTCEDANKDHACDYGCDKAFGTCEDANKDHICDYGCAKTHGTCEDADKDHDCDYGCSKIFGEHTDGDDNNHLCDYGCEQIADDGCYDTVADGKCDECGADLSHTCVDENTNHACDICAKAMGEHADANKDHACDYGCSNAIGSCVDANKDHVCDYGCGKSFGDCADADKDHECDYGCGKSFGDCADTNRDHECDYGCGKPFGNCLDTDMDHRCDYGCGKVLGSCRDNDKDHKCDHGCGKSFGICEDADGDQYCDYGCGKFYNNHFDSATDGDHLCDCGCQAVLEECSDAAGDGDHNCDVCGNADISAHSYGAATCGAPATCFECGATTGETLAHKDDNHDHICDNNCGKNDLGDHADSDADQDHVCDYGCGAAFENCADVDTDNDHACDVCGKADVTSHAHVEDAALATEATCNTVATKTYVCNCGDTYTENNGDALGHDITGVKATERLVNGCEYVLVYVCKRGDCGAEVLGETVYHHNHVASITTPATCSQDGVKTLTCACGDTKTEPIEKNATGHLWTNGAVVDGVRTDTCSVCSNTKTVTVYTGTTTDRVNAGDLADKEIELNDANISLDSGVIDSIGDQNVTVSADKVEGDDRTDLGLSNDQLAQVGDSPIYNFTINNGTENIANFGETNWVTITLPYTLAEGEDVDSIAVWFINDQGELESIKATYNNGYVTFKTNHFSYYTVTRLTPAERCALYGHGYVSQHVEGNCTKDAYDLYVCIRCHHKYIDEKTLVVADGHNYVADTHNATCTENGYVLYTCADCGHSYRTKLNATGHAWSIVESVETACTADGYTKYGCDNCEEEYIVTYAKLAHVYTTTVVAATCTADGYTLHDCDNCDYSYTDAYVEAFGHTYTSTTWAWAADYSTATLTFVCENDAEHVMVLNAAIEVTVIESACSDFVKTTYVAVASYNDLAYTDVKVVEVGTPGHQFSTEWSKNETEHWHECVCGEKTDVTKHVFENVTVTKAPTCITPGESVSYCVCGEEKTSVVPATGAHNYVNGLCETCGKAETDCDHTELHRESIDFGALGACEWVLYYETCECGEVKILDMDSDIDCDLDETYEENEYVDENGNRVATMSGACHCGVQVTATAILSEDGCTRSYTFDYTFKFNDAVVIEHVGYAETDTYHGSEVRVPLDLSEYGACGGTLTVYKCEDCGEITNLYDMQDIVCNIDLNSEPPVEEIVDAKGNVHRVQKAECPVCGLAFVVDMWVEQLSVCETITHMTITIRCGETKIVERSENDYDDSHEYEYTYELQGETCKDGVKITATCTVCGDNYSYNTDGHAEVEYNVEINLSEYGACDGVIIVDRCTVCGGITQMHDADINCDANIEATEEITDAEGNVIGERHSFTCSVCGLTRVEQEWIEAHSTCEYTEHFGAYLYKGEECIFAYEEEWYSSNHKYEYTYELEGESCDDRYKVIAHCTVCGSINEWWSSGHRYDYFEMNLADHNGCGGIVSGQRCTVCGLIRRIDMMDVGCNVNDSVPEEIVDENGVTHLITTVTCPDCGLRFVTDAWEVAESVCVTNEFLKICIYSGEECIVDCTQNHARENHNFEYSYELQGETCEDGYKVTHHCTVCDWTGWWYSSGHDYEAFEIDLSQHGCPGVIYTQRCVICGDMADYDMNLGCSFNEKPVVEEIVDENGITHYVETQVCSVCGLRFVGDTWMAAESACTTLEYRSARIYKGEELIFDHTLSYRQENHQYEYTYEMEGESCEDGYHVNRFCPVCGERERYYGSGHRYEQRHIEFSELGLCGGWVQEEYCPICNTILYYNVRESCSWSLVEESTDGHSVYACEKCGATKLLYVHDGEKNEICQYTHTEIGSYILNGAEVYAFERTVIREEHTYRHDFVMSGSSCTDGYTVVTTCEDCDLREEYTSRHHESYELFALTEEYGCCDEHNVYVTSCPCGQEFYIEFNGYSFEYNEETQLYTCSQCALTVSHVVNEVEEGCALIEITNFTVKLGDQELYSVVKERAHANHSFGNVTVSAVDGATMVTTSCTKCDAVSATEILQVTMEYHEAQGDEKPGYYCDYTFVPDATALYTIMGLADRDTYVKLYQMVDGELVLMSWDDDGMGNQFNLAATLTAGETYVYRISFYGQRTEGVISFALTEGQGEAIVCWHNQSQAFSVLLAGSVTCEDGAMYGDICTQCGWVHYVHIRNYHENILQNRVDLAEHGACYGELLYYSCACGQEQYVSTNMCYDSYNTNEYYDEEGKLIYVETRTCSQCGLRYTRSSYSVKDRENCTLTSYYTIVLNIGADLVVDLQYSTVAVDHDFSTSATLINGAGSLCTDGVLVTHKCKDCAYEESSEAHYHLNFEKERIDLAALGSVCGGYATLNGCACDRQNSLSLEHSLCERGSQRCNLWIEGVVSGRQYTITGSTSFTNNAYLYICAVTDPAEAACAYKIRYATYWVKRDGSCMADRYQTWQFGYDAETDTCRYEITFKTGASKVCHNYVDGSTDNYVKYDCPDCGSYYYENWYYDANNFCTKYEKRVYNATNDGNNKYYERVEEYSQDAEGYSYMSREYEKYIFSDDSEFWRENLRVEEAYTGTFGEKGRRIVSSSTDSNGESYQDDTAYVWYKGYDFTIYSYRTEGEAWYKHDYTYSFENGCVQTEIYTNSNGERSENSYGICRFWNKLTLVPSTCSQDGLECSVCVVCEKQTEAYVVSPHDHNWVQIYDNWYYCFTCGLENANGISGDIIMEDLTDAYGNGEYYVVGYYARNSVEFSQYVSLILADGTEVAIWEGIDFVTIDGIRAFAFSKAAVEAWATTNGYTDYDVRFSFVPVGSDGSFDYGITFTETIEIGTITGYVSFVDYVGAGESKSYVITPAEDGVWAFNSFATGDTYGYLYDAEGVELARNDDSGYNYGNFKITYDLKAGQIYTVVVRWYNSQTAGDIPLIFGPVPVTAE